MQKNLITVLLFAFLAFLAGNASAAIDPDRSNTSTLELKNKRVLLIYSYHPGFPTSRKVMDGIREGFGDDQPVIDVEFMDSKRLNDKESQRLYYQLLQYKLKNRPPYDLIITADDNALLLILDRGEELFPDARVVFLGVNNIGLAKFLDRYPLITGVVEAASFQQTVELIRSLTPERTRLNILVDGLTSGQSDLDSLRDIKSDFPDMTFNELLLDQMSWSELSGELQQLGKNDSLLLLSAYRDGLRVMKSFDEGLAFVAANADVPIWHLWEHGMGAGVMGGVLVSHQEQGRQAALMARKILLNNKMEDSVMDVSPNVAMFDYRQLQRFGISIADLPPNAQVKFKPASTLDSYLKEIILLSGLFVSLLILSVFLARKNMQMRLLSTRLSEQSSFLRLLMSTLPDLVWIKDPKGFYLACNTRFEKMYGLPEKDIIGHSDYEFVDKELADLFRHNDLQAMKKRGVNVNEEVVTFKDGHQECLETVKVPVYESESGKLLGVLGVGRDITARRKQDADVRANEKKYRTLFEEITQGVVVYDREGLIVDANPVALSTLGRTLESIQGTPWTPDQWLSDILMEEEGIDLPRAIRDTLNDGRLRKEIILGGFSTANHGVVWLELDLIPLMSADSDKPEGVFVSFNDETARREADDSLRLFARVFSSSAEGVLITDANAEIIEVNRAFSQVCGYSRDEVLGKNPSLLRSGLQDETFYQKMWKSIHETGRWSGELWNRHKDGSEYPIWQTISSVRNTRDEVVNYVAVFSDISKIKESQQEIYHLAYHDLLTGLPNRLLLRERLDQLIKRSARHQRHFTLMFLDLDNFKNVNDSLGHTEGDKLLQVVAAYFMRILRDEDTVARLGGDEFVFLFDELDDVRREGHLAQKILDVLLQPILLENREVNITASMGICTYPQDGDTADALLRNADTAMYRAKSRGRNTYEFYAEQLTIEAVERSYLENDLRRAISQNELSLNYQPQIDMNTGEILAVEALLRWFHPEKGFIPPNKFIPVAEESGLINPIGDWVIEEACKQASMWRDAGVNVGRVFVNIAGAQIVKGRLVETVMSSLSRYQLESSALGLEVTESMMMQYQEEALEQLHQLDHAGIEIAIDDFGTGFSSLSHLKILPIQKLKIDKSFIDDIPGDNEDVEIARTIIALSKALDLTVIAEGVETTQQAHFLVSEGCFQAQGYLYSKPLTAVDLEDFYRLNSVPGEAHARVRANRVS